ncbi:MAG: tyrosine-type recombinase/integrase [Bryobacterales bacterium]|nr:tyrosine-type recombinase/integrase [Bryobacterales bacterium]
MSARATVYNPSTAQLGPLEADVARKGTQQGHLRKRGGMWHVFYRDWLAAADGSVSYGPTSASTGCTAYKAAKVKASEIVAAANASAHCPRGTATLAQFVEAQYGPARLIAKAKATRDTEGWAIERYLLPAFGKVRLLDITHHHVQLLISNVRAAGKSRATAYQVRAALSQIFTYAKKTGAFHGDRPTEGVELGEDDKREAMSLTWPQVQLLLSVVPERHRALVTTLALTGMRAGEALGLRWRSVNLTAEWKPIDGGAIRPYTIHIADNFTHGQWKTRPKAKKVREYPIPSALWVVLQDHFEHSRWNGPDQAAFSVRNGKPMTSGNFAKRVLKPAGAKVGLPNVHLHAFRHTAATIMDQQGMSPAEKQAVLGHATAAMTAHYTHPQAEAMRQKLEGMVN